MFFHIKISSKDKKILKDFGHFLSRLEKTSNFLKSFPRQNTHKFVTILKSPHINKTAQEQFEFRYYTKEFFINSFKPLTFFLILKKVNNLSFSGINLKVKGLFKSNLNKKLIVINPDNIDLDIVTNYGLIQKKNLKQKTFRNRNFNQSNNNRSFYASKRYIQLFDCYGELSLKTDLYSK